MELQIASHDFVVAFLFGLIPAIFWLWFWLREDKKNPEPILLIIITFIAGMAVVPLALPLQKMAIEIYAGANLVLVWVIIEEVLKYAVALMVIFWNRAVDEPIDFIIYMIAIALGFAALENALFILTPLSNGELNTVAVTGSFRFLGATLLHVLASATIGICLAFAFYKSVTKKLLYGTFGLFIAILLHALFNFFIIRASEPGKENGVLFVLLFVWMGIVLLFLLFEKIKLLESTRKPILRK
ncbi:MAG: PrsW family glutamic-type intramembrane protease [Candidatus Paceibacterota bacterium]